MTKRISIVWFRQDLRIADNPALRHACSIGAILPVYIEDWNMEAVRAPGGASRWWLHHSLSELHSKLGGLHVFQGAPLDILQNLIRQTGATGVYWNRCYEAGAIARDREIKSQIRASGIGVESFNSNLLIEPWNIKTGNGDPYKVFTPFWKTINTQILEQPTPAPSHIELAAYQSSLDLSSLGLLPTEPDWAGNWGDLWQPGETGAALRLEQFFESGLQGYGTLRDRPDLPNVSRLSPHLHFGEISPRQIFAKTKHLSERDVSKSQDASKFLSEIAWREFSYHLLFHFPKITHENWKAEFDSFPWQTPDVNLAAWEKGLTGYPLVDAGMRELWQTGYMHNRVRMVAASFLVKHLGIDWRFGESWFWDTLLDADLASNCASWQWVAGSGADASPYFRIFNPTTQARKFDPDGIYIRKWCPELTNLPNAHIHAPFEASPDILFQAGVELGKTYPRPIVEHSFARNRALEGYEKVKAAKSTV